MWNEPSARGEELDDDPFLRPRGDVLRDEWAYEAPDRKFTDVKEVWFAGCHADIGGGSHSSAEKISLSNVTLRWMIKECFVARTGIIFHTDRLRELGFGLDALEADLENIPTGNGIMPNGKVGSPDSLDTTRPFSIAFTDSTTLPCKLVPEVATVVRHAKNRVDAIAPIYDQLLITLLWWMLELIPMLSTYQQEDGRWVRQRLRNFGTGRYMPQSDDEVKVHVSVLERIREAKPYKPAAYNWDDAVESEMVRWVD